MNIQDCQTLVQLSQCLRVDAKSLNRVFKNRTYNVFKVPKKQVGKWRTIEDPADDLELVQRRLAKAFNNLYEKHLPLSVHGFIPKFICQGKPRDIFSNASTHLNCDFVLNVDLKDFFHSVTKSMIKKRLVDYYDIDSSIAAYIAKIATYKKRLPMGSSLSPVMSNLMALQLDIELETIAKQNNLSYSRYVDDITFSGDHDFKALLLPRLDKLIAKYEFERNEAKISYFKQGEISAVTGLLLHADGTLYPQKELLDSINENVLKLHSLKQTYQNCIALGIQSQRAKKRFKKLKNSISGQISFVERVLGSENIIVNQLSEKYNNILSQNYHIIQHIYI